jgi:hypothetical protein
MLTPLWDSITRPSRLGRVPGLLDTLDPNGRDRRRRDLVVGLEHQPSVRCDRRSSSRQIPAGTTIVPATSSRGAASSPIGSSALQSAIGRATFGCNLRHAPGARSRGAPRVWELVRSVRPRLDEASKVSSPLEGRSLRRSSFCGRAWPCLRLSSLKAANPIYRPSNPPRCGGWLSFPTRSVREGAGA